jgi:hypothetical protein
MKISEGIRIGTQGKRQIKNACWNNKDGVCAVGALIRLPYTTGPAFKGDVLAAFPALNTRIEDTFGPNTYPPACLLDSIINRNQAGWSFDQIIKWLESIGQ